MVERAGVQSGMGKRGSIRDVAARARVSPATVSNVLNHVGLVAQATRQRVEKAIRELNFVRNESARQSRTGRSRTIGLVVLDVGNPFFTDVARGVEEAAAERDMTVLLCSSSGDPEREAHQLTLLAEQRIQGILIVPSRISVAQLNKLRRSDTPVVLLDHKAPNRQICSVSVDDVRGEKQAVAHLLENGHRRIAFVGGEGRASQVRDRAQGARLAMEDAGRPGRDLINIDVESLNVTGGREAGQRLLAMSRLECRMTLPSLATTISNMQERQRYRSPPCANPVSRSGCKPPRCCLKKLNRAITATVS